MAGGSWIVGRTWMAGRSLIIDGELDGKLESRLELQDVDILRVDLNTKPSRWSSHVTPSLQLKATAHSVSHVMMLESCSVDPSRRFSCPGS